MSLVCRIVSRQGTNADTNTGDLCSGKTQGKCSPSPCNPSSGLKGEKLNMSRAFRQTS